jgi:multidrug efflux pump subunit AcrA (membrane-fusion protein)
MSTYITPSPAPHRNSWRAAQDEIARAASELARLRAEKEVDRALIAAQDARLAKAGADLEECKKLASGLITDICAEKEARAVTERIASERAAEVQRLEARVKELEKQNEWLRAAHQLLANDEAFACPQSGEPFFAMAEVTADGLPMLLLHMNDTFHYACADAEPFRYEDAPELLEIAKREGWGGLALWATERRKERGEHHEFIRPIEVNVDRAKAAMEKLEARIAELGPLAEVGRLAALLPVGWWLGQVEHGWQVRMRSGAVHAWGATPLEALQAAKLDEVQARIAARTAGIGEEVGHG